MCRAKFISDDEPTRIAEKVLAPDAYGEFVERLARLRELQEAIEAGKPSRLCRYEDPEENLRWCPAGLKIESLAVEDFMQIIIAAKEASNSEHKQAAEAEMTEILCDFAEQHERFLREQECEPALPAVNASHGDDDHGT